MSRIPVLLLSLALAVPAFAGGEKGAQKDYQKDYQKDSQKHQDEAAVNLGEALDNPQMWTGRTLSGHVAISRVVSDRAFWIDHEGEQLLVILDERTPALRDLRQGQVVHLEDAMFFGSENLARIEGQFERDTRRAAADQQLVLAADKDDVELLVPSQPERVSLDEIDEVDLQRLRLASEDTFHAQVQGDLALYETKQTGFERMTQQAMTDLEQTAREFERTFFGDEQPDMRDEQLRLRDQQVGFDLDSDRERSRTDQQARGQDRSGQQYEDRFAQQPSGIDEGTDDRMRPSRVDVERTQVRDQAIIGDRQVHQIGDEIVIIEPMRNAHFEIRHDRDAVEKAAFERTSPDLADDANLLLDEVDSGRMQHEQQRFQRSR